MRVFFSMGTGLACHLYLIVPLSLSLTIYRFLFGFWFFFYSIFIFFFPPQETLGGTLPPVPGNEDEGASRVWPQWLTVIMRLHHEAIIRLLGSDYTVQWAASWWGGGHYTLAHIDIHAIIICVIPHYPPRSHYPAHHYLVQWRLHLTSLFCVASYYSLSYELLSVIIPLIAFIISLFISIIVFIVRGIISIIILLLLALIIIIIICIVAVLFIVRSIIYIIIIILLIALIIIISCIIIVMCSLYVVSSISSSYCL